MPTGYAWTRIELSASTYRHFRTVEPDVVNSPAGQMNPPVLHAVQDHGNGHVEVEDEVHGVGFLQLFRLLQRSRESCTDANFLVEFSRERVVVAVTRSRPTLGILEFLFYTTTHRPKANFYPRPLRSLYWSSRSSRHRERICRTARNSLQLCPVLHF